MATKDEIEKTIELHARKAEELYGEIAGGDKELIFLLASTLGAPLDREAPQAGDRDTFTLVNPSKNEMEAIKFFKEYEREGKLLPNGQYVSINEEFTEKDYIVRIVLA